VLRRVPCLVDFEVGLDDCVRGLGGVDGANLEGRHRFLFFVMIAKWMVILL